MFLYIDSSNGFGALHKDLITWIFLYATKNVWLCDIILYSTLYAKDASSRNSDLRASFTNAHSSHFRNNFRHTIVIFRVRGPAKLSESFRMDSNNVLTIHRIKTNIYIESIHRQHRKQSPSPCTT